MIEQPVSIAESAPLLALVLEAVKERRLACLPLRRRRAA
jgi:hypothetical protein